MERYTLDYMIEEFEKISHNINIPNALKSLCLEIKETKSLIESKIQEDNPYPY